MAWRCPLHPRHADPARRARGQALDIPTAEATILYSCGLDANGGALEALLREQDTIISDELNHASPIDGIRLVKAEWLRCKNADMGRP